MTPTEYYAIQDHAHELAEHIGRQMGKMESSRQLPDEWHQLHEWMKLAHVISGQAQRAGLAARDLETCPGGC